MNFDEIKTSIKILLHLETDEYDDELAIYIPSAISKTEKAGLDSETFTENEWKLYVVILAYEVALNIDIDVDINRLLQLYLTNIIILRDNHG